MSRGCSFGSVGLGLGMIPVFWGIIEINYSCYFFLYHIEIIYGNQLVVNRLSF